jgi:hypothetical protein
VLPDVRKVSDLPLALQNKRAVPDFSGAAAGVSRATVGGAEPPQHIRRQSRFHLQLAQIAKQILQQRRHCDGGSLRAKSSAAKRDNGPARRARRRDFFVTPTAF